MDPFSRNQDIAAAFCNHERYYGKLGCIENTGSLCIYNPEKGCFEIQDNKTMNTIIYRFMNSCSKKSFTMAAVADVREHIKQQAERRFKTLDSNLIALQDCILNLETFQTSPYNIENDVFFHLPFKYADMKEGEEFKNSRFAKFLGEVLVTKEMAPDTELITLVQELFGYCLLANNSIEASFFLVGQGQNGKSVLLHLLENMIGSEFCSHLSVEGMTTSDHATTVLVGKRLNVCTEEESAFVKSDKFKSLVSGEPTTINYKFGEIFSAKLPVKYVFATNEIPSFSGFNKGLLRRIKIIPFRREITEKEKDLMLKPTLLKELPLVVAWALRGAKRLVENKYKLSSSTASEEMSEDFASSLSAAVAFVREEYQEKEGAFIFNTSLYTHYVEWSKDNGKKQMSSQKFHSDINRHLKLPAEKQYNKDTQRSERGRALIRKTDPDSEPNIIF